MATNVLERMVRAVDKVRERLVRVTRALDAAGISYAVIGGQAVAAWVATADEAAVRNTRGVDVLLNRRDLEHAREALEDAGFVYRHDPGTHMFLDGPDAKERDAVHVIFSGEKVRTEYVAPAPELAETQVLPGGIGVPTLNALVRMKLTSYRLKDQVHLQDLIEVGLVGAEDLAKLPNDLAARLRPLIEEPGR
jgi:hypothetical protein